MVLDRLFISWQRIYGCFVDVEELVVVGLRLRSFITEDGCLFAEVLGTYPGRIRLLTQVDGVYEASTFADAVLDACVHRAHEVEGPYRNAQVGERQDQVPDTGAHLLSLAIVSSCVILLTACYSHHN